MKRPVFYILILVLLQLLIVSCNGYDQRLEKADAVMETDPAEALKQLSAIDSKQLSEKDNAYYALLLTQAQIKTNDIVTSDSLIQIARNYYLNDDDGNLKVRTFLYSAMVSYNNHNMPAAMADVVVAYDIAKSENDPLWIARTSEVIGDIFCENYNFPQAEKFTAEAAENYKKAGKIENNRYALSDLALTYANGQKVERAIEILDSLDGLLAMDDDSDVRLHEYLVEILAFALSKSGRLDKLANIREDLEQIEPVTNGDAVDNLISLSHIKGESSPSSVDSILKVARQYADNEKRLIRVLYQQYRVSMDSQRYKSAAQIADTLINLHEDIAFKTLNESMIGQQRDYYLLKNKIQQEQERNFRIVTFLTIALVLIVLCTILLILRFRLKKKRAELEVNLASLMVAEDKLQQSMKENKILLDTIDQTTKQITHLEQEAIADDSVAGGISQDAIEKLFREQWKTLNMLCREYFDGWESDKTKQLSLVNIEKELNKLREPHYIREIESAVDKFMGNVMTILRAECPFFKDKDYDFICLVYSGMSARSIGLLLNIKYKAVYLKKDRCKKRIEQSDAPHKDLLVAKFKNPNK